MYAVTDGFSGLNASFGTPGTGMNFLVHNMCRLPGSAGTWMVVQGGMGRVTRDLARVATAAGATILTGASVERITVRGGHATGVVVHDGRELDASVIVSNVDPFRLRTLVGANQFPPCVQREARWLQTNGDDPQGELGARWPSGVPLPA